MGERLLPIRGPMAQEFGQGGVHVDAVGAENDALAIGGDRAFRIFEWAGKQATELLEYLR